MVESRDFTQRFWKKVNKNANNDCWIWFSAKTGRGYGLFSINNVRHYAHRISYEITKGEIPDGMYVCHTCDNPSCVNPSHLWLGTAQDNAIDRNEKGRGVYFQNEQHPRCKFTDQQVFEMRERYLVKKEKPRHIIRDYGISRSQFYYIVDKRGRV
jgi:hypothetical protein